MLNILKRYTSRGFPYYVIKSIIVCVVSSSFVTEGQVKSREQFNLKLSSAKFDKTFMQILFFFSLSFIATILLERGTVSLHVFTTYQISE